MGGGTVALAFDVLGFKNLNLLDQFVKFLQLALDNSMLLTVLLSSGFKEQGWITQSDFIHLTHITHDLFELIVSSRKGDDFARLQIQAIRKTLYPDQWAINHADISQFAELDRTDYGEKIPSLARGWDIVKIMGVLSDVVEPKKKGAPLIPSTPIVLLDRQGVATKLYRKNLDWVMRHLSKCQESHKGMTLQSLAICLYRDQLKQEGMKEMDIKALKQDLKITREWQKRVLSGEIVERQYFWVHLKGGERLLYREIADGWKKRAKKKRQIKNDLHKISARFYGDKCF